MPSDRLNSASHEVTVLDRSLARPYFKHYCAWFLERLPHWVPANYVTIAGFGFSMSMPLVLVRSPDGGPWLFLLLGVLLNLYAVADQLDGQQAKKTQCTSQLGHFLDHYLDFFSSCAIISCTHVVSGLALASLIALLALNSLAFAAANVEERLRRVFYFGRFGALEAILLVQLYLVSRALGSAFGLDAVAFTPVSWVLLVIAVLGFGGSVFGTLRRIGRVPWRFGVDASTLIVASVSAFLLDASLWLQVGIPILFGAALTARLVFDNASKRSGSWPPMLVESLFVMVWFASVVLNQPWQVPLGRLVLATIALRVVVNTGKAAIALGGQWLWRNPIQPALASSKTE